MASVEAQRNLGGGQDALDLLLALDQRARMRVQHQLEADPRDELVDLREVVGQPAPGHIVEGGGRRPPGVRHDGSLEQLGARGGQDARDALGVGASGGKIALVQHERYEAADELQAVTVELGPQRDRLERQPADGAELGRLEAERRNLGQYPLRG